LRAVAGYRLDDKKRNEDMRKDNNRCFHKNNKLTKVVRRCGKAGRLTNLFKWAKKWKEQSLI
jgi:hypothetical protein